MMKSHIRHLSMNLVSAFALCALGGGCGNPPEAAPRSKPSPRVVQAKAPLGNCFEHSLKFVMLMHSDEPEGITYRQQFQSAGLDPKAATLVHGIPTHRDEGLRYPHAWVEVGDVVIDVTEALHAPVFLGNKARYYQLGQIRASECRRYSHAEAAEHVRLSGHSGPWMPLPEDVVVHVPAAE